MARSDATTAILLLLAGGAIAAVVSCEAPESVPHGNVEGLPGGANGITPAGAGGGAGDAMSLGSLAGGAGIGGRFAGGAPGDLGGAGGAAPGGAPGLVSSPGGAGEGGQPAAAGGGEGWVTPTGGAAAGGAGAPAVPGAGGASATGGALASGGRGALATGGASTAASGGAGGTAAARPCGTCTLSIECRNSAPTDTTSMNAELWISNVGDQPIALRTIKVRYYYTNEGGPMSLEIFDKAFKRTDGTGHRDIKASFSMTNGKLASPAMEFSDIANTGTDLLDGTLPFYFKMAIHDFNHTRLNLANDYSNGPAAIGPCPNIVALVNNVVAAGVPPE